MPLENNQNFNQPMPQQPQKSGSSLNTILLILLIALVGFGIWFLSQKKEEIITTVQNENTAQEPVINKTNENDNQNDNLEENSNIEDGSFHGIIKSISKIDNKYFLDIDYIQIPSSGEEAMQWAREDGLCSADCSAYSVSYTRNTNPQIRTIEFSTNASIRFNQDIVTLEQSLGFTELRAIIVVYNGEVVSVITGTAG